MNQQELHKMRAEIDSLLASSQEQGSLLLLLLALARENKIGRQELASAVDSLPLHPLVSERLKREAKKLIPIYFPAT